jgi:hypothetical protein
VVDAILDEPFFAADPGGEWSNVIAAPLRPQTADWLSRMLEASTGHPMRLVRDDVYVVPPDPPAPSVRAAFVMLVGVDPWARREVQRRSFVEALLDGVRHELARVR